MKRSAESLGVAAIAGAAVAWSTAGYFTRLIPVGLWSMLVWRNLFGGAFMFAYLAITRRLALLRDIAALGSIGWLAGVVNGLSMVCYLASLRHTSVANVVVIYATAPFVAATLAWLFYRDAASRQTLIAGVVALVGVAITIGGSPDPRGLTGDVLALLMTLGLATFTVILRRHRETPMLPAAAASAWIGSLVALPFVSTLSVTPTQLRNLVLFGVTSFGLGLVLYTLGARHVHAARSALISALDTPLAPLWVWLAFGERPATATFVGGALVMLAVFGNVVGERSSPTPPVAPRRRRQRIRIGVPTGVSRARRRIASSGTRMQPCETHPGSCGGGAALSSIDPNGSGRSTSGRHPRS